MKNAPKLSTVVCVFDRYFVKTSARMQRAESSRVHNLLLDMPTPQEQVILSVTKNKVIINAMLAEALLDLGVYAQATSQNRLIIVGVTDVPVQITHDLKIIRRDFSSSHEEAAVIIAQLAVAMSLEDKSVCVVCDVFLLSVHLYKRMCLNQAPVIMALPVRDRAVTDIHSTVAFHNDIASDLLVIYGLSGANTIAALHGIGETMTLKVARKGQFSLGAIGDIEASMDSVMSQSVAFISALCG